jgi:translation elongation factor EF-Tu-like GTPase
MATKKKAKTKTKKKKASTRKIAARKKVAPKKKPATKTKAKRSVALKPVAMSTPATPAAPPGMERVGVVTHYFNHLSVAILKLEKGVLRVGDLIHIKGHTSDFSQTVDSMEIDHVHVNEARPGQSFGLRVKDHAREHDVVYKAKS